MIRERERGAGRLKAIIWLLIFLALVYLGIKIVPAYFNNYQLEDTIRVEARFATVQRKAEEDIRNDIYRKIQDLDIPARREDIRVQSTDRGVRISVDYTVEVDLLGYKLRLQFNPSADNRAL